MNDLFPGATGDSPRLAWVKRHAVRTLHVPGVAVGDECPETGREMYPWVAWISGETYDQSSSYNRAGGATEDDAIATLAKKRRWRLWNEEGLL